MQDLLKEDDISYEAAALVEPLSCVYNGQMLLGIRPGDDVLIIGLGPIGIMPELQRRGYGQANCLIRAGRICHQQVRLQRIQAPLHAFNRGII